MAKVFSGVKCLKGLLLCALVICRIVSHAQNYTYSIQTIAGQLGMNGFCGDDSLSIGSKLNMPQGIAVDKTVGMPRSGNIYIVDRNNKRIRVIDPKTGKLTTFAGGGKIKSGAGKNLGDGGLAKDAVFIQPTDIAVDPNSGNVYISDLGTNSIRYIDNFGFIWTVVDTVTLPMGLAIDKEGNIYVAQRNPFFIIKYSAAVNNTPNTSTPFAPEKCKASLPLNYVGNGWNFNTARYKVPENGLANCASLRYLAGIAIDPARGYLYIADEFQDRILRVTLSDNGAKRYITTIAGNGEGAKAASGSFSEGAGNATSYALNRPSGIAVDGKTGAVFFADANNQRIRKLTPNSDFTIYAIATIAGNPPTLDSTNLKKNAMNAYTGGKAGDGGLGTEAQLSIAYGNRDLTGLAVDNNGKVYFSDRLNHAIRVLEPHLVPDAKISNLAMDSSITASINVFPNPALTAITFQFSEKSNGVIQLSDMTGKVVAEQSVNNQVSTIMSVVGYVPGIYIYQINTNFTTKTGKIVIQ